MLIQSRIVRYFIYLLSIDLNLVEKHLDEFNLSTRLSKVNFFKSEIFDNIFSQSNYSIKALNNSVQDSILKSEEMEERVTKIKNKLDIEKLTTILDDTGDILNSLNNLIQFVEKLGYVEIDGDKNDL